LLFLKQISIVLSELDRVVCVYQRLVYLSFGLHDLGFGDVILDDSLSKVKHSPSIMIDCVFNDVLKMLPIFNDLSPLSDTSRCITVVKPSKNIR